MKSAARKHHPIRQAKSFKYAFKGIWHALLNEPNFRVQVLVVIISIALGIRYSISNIEWGLLTISMGMLLSAEMVNTVVEEFIDHLIKDERDSARIIKDLAAGFVLTAALTALIIFILIFGSRLQTLLY